MATEVDADESLRQLAMLLKKKRMRASDLFNKLDASGDGTLERDELREGLRMLGLEVSDADFDVIMVKTDKDGGGDVSLKEFDRALKAAEKLPPPKKKDEGPKKKQGLTGEDMEEFRQIFCLFKQLCRQRSKDPNDDDISLVQWDESGNISVEELEMLLDTVGLHIEQSELETMVKEIDLDGNGEIDFSEFCGVMTRKIQVEYPPDDIAKSFKAFAKNAPDGLIRVQDLRNALKTYMHKEMIDAEIDALLLHYQDCFVRPLGSEVEYFNYQDYIDLMTPMVPSAASNE
mmetsp:Transcript_70207/g.196790  ORF Transcript_70207/g.196790 Transcript_70207/m.196790 type:complete len:288 (-) Transcript_70207:144-1007(-)